MSLLTKNKYHSVDYAILNQISHKLTNNYLLRVTIICRLNEMVGERVEIVSEGDL
jgi:hypothetical protein